MSWENLSSIIKKNFKILWRSKISAMAIVIVPLIVVLLVGIGFSTSSFGSMNVGVFSENYNDLTNSSIDIIKEKGYKIQKYSSEENCEKSVKDGKTKICIVFPKGLSIESEESIEIYSDQSRTDIAYYLINSIQSQISKKSSGISEVEVQKLINSLNEAKKTISSVRKDISDMKNKINSAENSASGISSKTIDIDTLFSRLNSINSSLENLPSDNETDVDEIREDLETVRDKAIAINYTFNNIEKDSGNLDKDLSDLKQLINSVDSELNNLHQKLSSTEIAEAEHIANPLKTNIKSLKPNSSNWDNMFPSFLLIVILFCSIILASSLIIREKKAGAYFRNSITSTSNLTFIIGTYITCLIILILQLLIVLTGVHFIIGTSLDKMVLELALAVLFSSSIFIFLGMLVGYAFKSEETTMVVSISLVALFLFFSNVIFPIEALSGPLERVISYNPAAVSNNLFRKIVLFKYEVGSMLKSFYILAGTLVITMLITLGVKKLSIKRT